MPNLGVIIQARMGSTRLPGKVLMEAGGKSIIRRIYETCSDVYKTVVAIPFGDEGLAVHLNANNIPFFTGHATDVLDRYLKCARENMFSHVIRVTGDCPLLSKESLFWIGEHGPSAHYDFYSNAGDGRKSIDGEDVEMISMPLLCWLVDNTDGSDREHVTSRVYRGNLPAWFKVGMWRDTGPNLSHIKTSIDNQDDFNMFTREVEREATRQ